MKTLRMRSGNTRRTARAEIEGLEARKLLSGYAFHVLASFNLSDGAAPEAPLTLDSSGDVFGTTVQGGTHTADGTVFEIAAATSSITTLADFNGLNGANPMAGLTLDSSGDLFGTTQGGGTSDDGTVFEVATGTGSITAIASFSNADDISSVDPKSLTLDSSGNLFGTAEQGGTDGIGFVFKIAAGTTSITTLASFDAFNGRDPLAGLTLDSSGNLFGTASGGGNIQGVSDGLVFEIPAGSTTLTTVATFDGDNGSGPDSLTLDSSGDLFGATTLNGTSLYGTVFEIAAHSSSITTLANFSAATADGTGAVTLDSSGDLFGTTSGGTANEGGVYEVAAGSSSITMLASFNTATGYGASGLTRDSGGDLFGTTEFGGTSANGTVFELTAGGGGTGSGNLSPSLSGVLPPSVVPGVRQKIAEKLKITALSGPAKGNASAEILLSPDEAAGESVLTLATYHGRLNLKAGKSASFNVRFPASIPTSIAASNYHVLIQFTDPASVVTTIDSGQTLSVVAPAVDLTGSFVKVPASAQAAKKFSATFLLTNLSDANVPAVGLLPIDIETSPDGQLSDATALLSQTRRINLKPGKSVRITVKAELSSSAFLVVALDPGNQVFADDTNPNSEVFGTTSQIQVG